MLNPLISDRKGNTFDAELKFPSELRPGMLLAYEHQISFIISVNKKVGNRVKLMMLECNNGCNSIVTLLTHDVYYRYVLR